MSTVTESRPAASSTPVSSEAVTTTGSELPPPLSPKQISEKIEIVRGKLRDPSVKITKELVLVTSTDLQSLYKKLLMYDLEGGIQRQLDNLMWTDCFKLPLTIFMKQDKTLYHWMIEAGVGFYLGFIQDVGIHFDVPFIRNSVRNLFGTVPKLKVTSKTVPPKSCVYYIIQNSMVHVGDLLRYRGSFVEALRMYEKSTSVNPNNGHPFNQMGLVQLSIDSKSIESLLSGIYYYVRAISVTNPFVPAQDNLNNLLTKAKGVTPRNKDEEFVHNFLLGIGQLESVSVDVSSWGPALTSMVVKKAFTFHHLFRILCIALWVWKRESIKANIALESTPEQRNTLEIMAALLNGLVAGLREFSELSTARYMPHLKICIDWLRLHPKVLKNETFLSKLDVPNLCLLANRLVPTETSYVEVAKDLQHVILPEEKKLLGFLPLAKYYDHLQCPFDEMDPRLYSLRTGRFMQALDSLSELKPQFMERNVLTREYKPLRPIQTSSRQSGFPAPSRRNVALQSIFNQINSSPSQISPLPPTSYPVTDTDFDFEPLPTSSDGKRKSTIGDGRKRNQSSSPPSYFFEGESNPPTPDPEKLDTLAEQTTPPQPSPADMNGEFNSLFTSIWTPFSEKTINSNGWK